MELLSKKFGSNAEYQALEVSCLPSAFDLHVRVLSKLGRSRKAISKAYERAEYKIQSQHIPQAPGH